MEVHDGDLSADDRLEIALASLLHDADDPKFFPENKNYENTRKLLRKYSDSTVKNVLKYVDLVSCSGNGDRIPEGITEKMLIPRYSDRLEAVKFPVGIIRCLQYTKTKGRPLYTKDTERAKDEKDLWERVATEERYLKYSTQDKKSKVKSPDFISHFYDKLLHVHKFPIKNKYLFAQANTGLQPMIDIVLLFGSKGSIDESEINSIIEKYSTSTSK